MVISDSLSAKYSCLSAYGKAVWSERSCREWFHKFKNAEYEVEDKKRNIRLKSYEGKNLEAFLKEDSC